MSSSTSEFPREAAGRTMAPENVFLRVFRALKPRAEAPDFDVQFRPFATLRSTVRFEQDGPRILAKLSDQLLDAPGEVLEALATILLAKLYRERIPGRANKTYRSWLNSPVTHQRMLQARRARGRKHLLPPRGRVHDLGVLFERLNERYFDGSLHKPSLGWSSQASRTRLGHYDAAHDAIVISRIFDKATVPVLLVEYVLYHEMLHVQHPVQLQRGRRRVHTPEFLEAESRFVGILEAKRLLRAL